MFAPLAKPRSAGKGPAQHARVGYDARLSIGAYRGMGRFLRHFIAGNEQDFLGFCATGECDESLNLLADGMRPYPLWEQFSLPNRIRERGIEIFIAPYNTAPVRISPDLKLIVVVHDLIYMDPLPSSISAYQNLGRLYRKAIVPLVAHRADWIVTPSEFTKAEIIQRFRIPDERIAVIPNTIGIEWFDKAAYNPVPDVPYVLTVSGEAPSKNLVRAILAFAQYVKRTGDSTRRLKIVGVKERFHYRFQEVASLSGVGHRIDLFDYLQPQQLLNLYREAELFLMPSVQEGFGIPILEAMAVGLPVIASRASCLPEIGGDAARYFDPRSIDDISEVMTDVIASPDLRRQMSIGGLAQAARFHPDVVQAQVRQFWLGVLARPLRRHNRGFQQVSRRESVLPRATGD